MKHSKYILPFLVFLLVILTSCDDTLSFNIRYKTISGLTKGAPIYFQQNMIGTVTDVSYTEQGNYLVGVAINKGFHHAATVDSHFYLGNAPDAPKTRAIIVEQQQAGGPPITTDMTVTGEQYPGIFDGLSKMLTEQSSDVEQHLRQLIDDFNRSLKETSIHLDKEMQKTLETITDQLQGFSQELQDMQPSQDEVEKFKESLTDLKKELQTAPKDIKVHIETVILPNIRQQLDELRQRFQKEGRDHDVEEIDHLQKQIDTMTRI